MPSVSLTRYVEYARRIAQTGLFSTTICCLILIILTIFGVKRNFGSYKHFLIVFPSLGILFAVLEFILYPNVHSHKAGYVFYSTSHPFNLGKTAVTWMLAFYSGVYSSTISMLSVQFLYRYWAVFCTTKLRYFKGWRFGMWFYYVLSYGLMWAMANYHFTKVDDYAESYMKQMMMERYGVEFSNNAWIICVAYYPDGSPRWWNLFCTITMTFIMVVQYSVIVYCSIRMYIDMEDKIQILSPSLRALHKQFFKTLILQVVTPTITLFSPVIFIIYLPLFDMDWDIPTGTFLCGFTLYPAMDAIIVLYVVQDYRKAVMYLLRKMAIGIREWSTTATNRPATRSGSFNVAATFH
ncbi:Protein CBG10400 [Caenorhabditis briggsae]|uniref:Protein CBG10400 n=1 Tax=Caenorhabditis briggsae TaxID=6238 RepID=A8XB43_CAEBR|nr:Protein CBG10400 [Caenorhabditis briggsae]CAP29823.2 Protein CBG10400 [Caenorhabditis briggsae]